MERKVAHLQMIQAVVGRMATASFVVRGWAITLVAAIFALSDKDTDRLFFLLAYLPILAFWVLDGFYLSHERRFRDLYDAARTTNDNDVDFSMDVSRFNHSWPRGCFSLPTLVFYGVLAVAVLVVMFVIK